MINLILIFLTIITTRAQNWFEEQKLIVKECLMGLLQ